MENKTNNSRRNFFIVLFAAINFKTGRALEVDKKIIVGEWEATYKGVYHSLVLFENGTGEAGGEEMETVKIEWEPSGDEFKLSKDGKSIVMAKLVEKSLVLRQPNHPEMGTITFQRKRINNDQNL